MKTRFKSKGERAFSAAAPRLLNPLPVYINSSHLWMLSSLDWNRTFLVELLESIRGIKFYILMLN